MRAFRRSLELAAVVLALALMSSPAFAAEASAVDMTAATNFTGPAHPFDAVFAASETPSVIKAQAPHESADQTAALRRSLYVSFAVLQALDARSTLAALRNGGAEANPLMAGAASNPGALLAVKMGAGAATIFVAEHVAKRNPVASLLIMAAMNSAYATIVAHNYSVAGR
jgi:hypothetical protein